MEDKLKSVHLASLILVTYYKQLATLSFDDKEDDPEYEELITKISKGVNAEQELYHMFTKDELRISLIQVNPISNDHLVFSRIKRKLEEALNNRELPNHQVELRNMMTAKIIIDALKSIDKEIENMDEEDHEEGFIDEIKRINKYYKFSLCTPNTFLEKLALKANFDIQELPDVNIESFAKKYGMVMNTEVKRTAYNCVKESIVKMINNETGVRSIDTYYGMLTIAKIESALEYVDKEYRRRIIKYLDAIALDEKDERIVKIRKLVKNEKEEN